MKPCYVLLFPQDKHLNITDITRLLKYGDFNADIAHPFIICLSFKDNDVIFKNINDQKEMDLHEDFAVVHSKHHQQMKSEITKVIKDQYYKHEHKYYGIILLMLCIVDNYQYNWYFDTKHERRHFEKLRKDIIYRIDDNLSINCNYAVVMNEY